VSRAIAPAFLGEASPRPNTEVVMAAHTVSLTGSRTVSERMIAGALALFLGAFFVWGAGFANSATLHEAAHDTRHAYGFPCH
jgi:cobalt transporter subunit CbtB